jgi:hypothetical protein
MVPGSSNQSADAKDSRAACIRRGGGDVSERSSEAGDGGLEVLVRYADAEQWYTISGSPVSPEGRLCLYPIHKVGNDLTRVHVPGSSVSKQSTSV